MNIKIASPLINSIIEVNEGEIYSLAVENQYVFRSIIEDLRGQSDGLGGSAVLSNNDIPIGIEKNLEIIDRFAPFDINTKSLLTRITASLEKTAVNEVHYLNTSKLLGDIERFIYDISFDYPCTIECRRLNIGTLLKTVAVSIREDYDNSAEKIIDYMKLVREFEGEKLFLMVNMRAYFSDDEMNLFAQTVNKHKFYVLLLDGVDYPAIIGEKRLVIDKDICEIIKNA